MDVEEVLASLSIAVVVPAYQAERSIEEVLTSIPAYVRSVVVVLDCCSDRTAEIVDRVAARDRRIVRVDHERNCGVGAAMRTGYRRALADGAEIVAKIDSDGQMDPEQLWRLLLPIALGRADYAKGNRFHHPREMRSMPLVRLIGNAALSFLSKLSTGYWNLLDPTNGYTAISREALQSIDLARLDDRFFFESSMLCELALARAVCVDVPIPARYGSEASHLSVTQSLFEFAAKHARNLLRRIWLRYLILDFSAASLLLVLGVPLALFGVIFGLRSWAHSSFYGVPATAGTVMLAAFTTAAGLFGLVQALIYDIMSVPQVPLTAPRTGLQVPNTLAQAPAPPVRSVSRSM
ncbi:MAG TPA: glycosyltransferase family 2 protein [Candidatus Limnocylindrales bacterium]|nr:glycosyltransferase family 2 protein [Candidatus Limnocylindrales bacterium]